MQIFSVSAQWAEQLSACRHVQDEDAGGAQHQGKDRGSKVMLCCDIFFFLAVNVLL